jgi:hypothetical protein
VVGGYGSGDGDTHGEKTTDEYGFRYSRVTHTVRFVLMPARSRTAPGHAPLEPGTGTLADLVADARAIPAAAFALSRGATRKVIDLTEAGRHAVIAIPEATATFMKDAEHAFADYLR